MHAKQVEDAALLHRVRVAPAERCPPGALPAVPPPGAPFVAHGRLRGGDGHDGPILLFPMCDYPPGSPAAPAAVAHGVHVHGVDLCGIVWPGHQEGVVVIVPRHRQNAVGTPRSFIRQVGFTAEEFRRLRD